MRSRVDPIKRLIESSKPQMITEPQIEEETGTKVLRSRQRHITRRASSEEAMNQVLDWHLEEGVTYHIISQGDVDALTFLRGIIKQQKLDYVLISTWVMSTTDTEEIERWIEQGILKRIDFYIGEIFESRDLDVYDKLKKIAIGSKGRVGVFRNHSKVILAYGERFTAAIASSANVNTNPRCENTTITVSKEVADFYKGFFDAIVPFNQRDQPTAWEPWGELDGR